MRSWWGRFSLSLIFAALIVFRDASLFIFPRFWAEEGAFWFSYAFSHKWIDALLSAHAGYYNFYPQLATVLAARIVPLEHAPLVTTLAAFLVQMVPLLIVVWDDSRLWNSWLKKVIWGAIFLFTPRSTEIWLNTNGSQYYLLLISVLVLLRDTPSRKRPGRRFLYATLILVAGLTGVLSCLLAPLFLYKGWKTRQSEAYLYAAILLACGLIQVYAAFPIRNPDRRHHPDLPATALILWTRSFLAPFSMRLAKHFGHFVHYLYRRSLYIFSGYVVLFLELAILWRLKNTIVENKGALLAGSFLFIAFFSTYFAIGGKLGFGLLHPLAGNRYFYVPNVLMLAMVFLSVDLKSGKLKSQITSWTALALLGIALFQGGFLFFKEPLKKPTWPVWREEIKLWQKNPSHTIHIWPTGWEVRLKKMQHHP